MTRGSATSTTVCIVIIGLFEESWKCKVLSGKKSTKLKRKKERKKKKKKKKKREKKEKEYLHSKGREGEEL